MVAAMTPYPVMKDSGIEWLGNVPTHWEILPGRACFREKKLTNFALQEKTVLSLSYGQIVVKPPEKLRGLVPSSFETYQIVDPLNIVIRPTDLQNDHNSLRFGLSRHRGIITSAYLCFLTSKRLVPEYGHFLLHSYDLMKIFYGLGSGLRQNLDWTDFRHLSCVVPPLREQTAIVRFLDHADRRIRRYICAKQKLIALLEEQKQAIIHQAVTRGTDPEVTLKPTGNPWFPKVPAKWEVMPLGRVITRSVDGPHHSPNYLDQGIPFLSARNIKADRWSLEDVKFISPGDYEVFCKRVKPEIGDVLYTKGGTTGVARTVDLEFPFQVWVHIAVLKLRKDRVLPRYLAAALNTPRCYEQSQLFTRGATNQDLGLGRMKEIVLPIPPLNDQSDIIECIGVTEEKISSGIQAALREIDLLHEYRTRLIADVVTGKLDVREAAATLTEVDPLAAEDDLDDVWTGEYTLLWKRPENYRDTIYPGDTDRTVGWVSAQLTSLPDYGPPLEESLSYGGNLEDRVRLLQKRCGLFVDGLVGKETLIKINTLVGTSPQLQKSEGCLGIS